jgi:hypothetical protein
MKIIKNSLKNEKKKQLLTKRILSIGVSDQCKNPPDYFLVENNFPRIEGIDEIDPKDFLMLEYPERKTKMDWANLYIKALKGEELTTREKVYVYACAWDWGVESCLQDNPHLKCVSERKLKSILGLPTHLAKAIEKIDQAGFSENIDQFIDLKGYQ